MLDSDVDGNGNANDNGDMNIGGAGNEYVGGDAYADAIMEVKEGDETTTTGDGDKDGDADCDADGDGDEMVMDTERGVRNGLLRGSTSATAGTTGGDGLGVTTSSQNGASVGTQVMAWEDPFRDSNNALYESNVSLPSVRRQAITETLANLHYRNIEIDTATAKVRYNSTFSKRDQQQLRNSGVGGGEVMDDSSDNGDNANANANVDGNDDNNLNYIQWSAD